MLFTLGMAQGRSGDVKGGSETLQRYLKARPQGKLAKRARGVLKMWQTPAGATTPPSR